jgi:hypothetical protein
MTERRRQGRLEQAVRRDLKRFGEKPQALSARAELAVQLAQLLEDATIPARDAAAVARELRAAMETLERRGDSDTGNAFVAGLLAPVDDAEDGPADTGRRARPVRGGVGDAADAVATPRRRRGARAGS